MACRIIRDGGLVAFPTETVYGLGADVSNSIAVARIFEVKARPRIDPLIVHVSDTDMAEQYARFPPGAYPIMEKFWPGPLTIVARRKESVPGIVTAGLDTVAIRIPSHPVALDLIRCTGRGIAAPSANPFGYVSPTDAHHVAEQLLDKVDAILDGGPCAIGLESTILSFSNDKPCILRPGGASIEDLSLYLGPLDILDHTSSRPQAPGQMERHYATRTKLEIIEDGREELKTTEKTGLLCLYPPDCPDRYEAVEVLSESRDLREAAANLFRALRRLDRMNLDRIIARPVPEKGLGIAIMDRLRRCSRR